MPIKLEDVQEFEEVNAIKRSYINDAVLEGVRQLDERKEIEVFLREILTDKTETPHGPTEVVDILTTHVHKKGEPCLAAFINKGKSLKKVTAKETAHQISRLKEIPKLDLAIFLAVGDIQDDAKKLFLRTVDEIGADYLIVDAVDIARLFISYQKICPKDGYSYIQGKCSKCHAQADEPIEITIKLYKKPNYISLQRDEQTQSPYLFEYDIVKQHDVSSSVKRYSADIFIDIYYSRAAIREVVKKATWELRQSNYYKSGLAEKIFGDREADCVFLFVYADLLDLPNNNWICRTRWIRPNSGINMISWKNNERLGEIEIDWKQDYNTRREFFRTNIGKKEDWIQKIETLLPKVQAIVEKVGNALADYEEGSISEAGLESYLGQLELEAHNLYRMAGNQKQPPLDCHECDLAFQVMMGHFHNILLPFASWGKVIRTWQNKMYLLRMYLKLYEEATQAFLHEWRKIRR